MTESYLSASVCVAAVTLSHFDGSLRHFLTEIFGASDESAVKKGNEVFVITSFVAASAAFHPVLFLSHTDEEHIQRLIFVGKIYNTLYDHRKDQHFVQQAWSDVEFVLLHTEESGSGLHASCIQTPWPAALRRYRRRRTAQCAGVGAPSAAPPPAGSPAGWTHLRPSESVNTCRLYFSNNTRSYIVVNNWPGTQLQLWSLFTAFLGGQKWTTLYSNSVFFTVMLQLPPYHTAKEIILVTYLCDKQLNVFICYDIIMRLYLNVIIIVFIFVCKLFYKDNMTIQQHSLALSPPLSLHIYM